MFVFCFFFWWEVIFVISKGIYNDWSVVAETAKRLACTL